MPKQPGQALREAWIAGVTKHYPGTPPPAYIAPWANTPGWERECAAIVEFKVRLSAATFREELTALTDDERGQFIASSWVTEILARVANPKASYLTHWDDLPEWQKKTNIDIFHVLENLALRQPHDEIPDYASGAPSGD